MDKQAIEMIRDQYRLTKNIFSRMIYIFLFIINLLLFSIIPFMYFTLLNPDKMYEGVMEKNIGFSFNNFLIYLVILLIHFIYRKNILTKLGRLSEGYKEGGPVFNETLKEIFRKIKVFKNVSLILFFFSSFIGFFASFLFVSGPLVFTHQSFFLNLVPTVLFFIFSVMNYPNEKNTIKLFDKGVSRYKKILE